MPDLLKVGTNERIDLVDFQHMVDETARAILRQPQEAVLTDVNKSKKWIVEGFDMTNPSAKQLQVDLGRAILAHREGSQIHYGMLTSEGDPSKTIDMSAFPGAVYNVYVRFEYVDGESTSRIFWNTAGDGEEFPQTVPTRRLANWSLRVETTNPGDEWLQIGTADNTGVGVVIVDQRKFYFEGEPNNAYQSGWSTEGGGDTNDRNADRANWGVKDLQTFTAAMRQCIEDIRGRGLKRWWEKGIGGMNIGFDLAPVANELAVGDQNFVMNFVYTNPRLYFDSLDFLEYDRLASVNGQYQFKIGGITEAAFDDTGMYLGGGAMEMSHSPTVSEIWMAVAPHTGWQWRPTAVPDPFLRWFVGGGLVGDFFPGIGVTGEANFNMSIRVPRGLTCNAINAAGLGGGIFGTGLVVGWDAVPTKWELSVRDGNFAMNFATLNQPRLFMGTNSYFEFDRSLSAYSWRIGGIRELDLDASTLSPAVTGGLDLGTPTVAWNDAYLRSIQWDGTSQPSVISPNTTISDNPICVLAKNVYGSTLPKGTIVVVEDQTSAEIHVSIVNTPASSRVFGIVQDASIASGSFGLIAVLGPCTARIDGPITAGQHIGTVSATAGPGLAGGLSGNTIGVATQTNNTSGETTAAVILTGFEGT